MVSSNVMTKGRRRVVQSAVSLFVFLVAFNQAINTNLVPKLDTTNLAQLTSEADQQTVMQAEADLIQGVRLVLKRR